MSPRTLQTLCFLVSVYCACSVPINDVTPTGNERVTYPGVGEYIFMGKPRTWNDAGRECQWNAAKLVVIDSEDEALAIVSMMKTYSLDEVWAGVHDQWIEGNYISVIGEAVPVTAGACSAFNPWATGFPYVPISVPNCVGLRNTVGESGYFNEYCANLLPTICEVNGPVVDTGLPGYTLVPSHGWYKHHMDPVKWTDADKTCRDEGAHLMILNSKAEAKAVTEKFTMARPFYLHVGIHRFFGDDNNFRTIFGSTLSMADTVADVQWYNDDREPRGTADQYPFVRYAEIDAMYSGLQTITGADLRPFVCEHKL